VRRIARPAAVVAAVSIAACFSKPGAPHVGDGDGGVDPDDGGKNADASTDGRNPICTNQPVDTFTTGTSCGAIGSAYGPSGAVSRVSGQLVINGFGSGGGCSSLTAFDFSQGTSIKVVQVATSNFNSNSTNFRVFNGTNGAEGMAIYLNSSNGSPSVYDVACIGTTFGDEKNYDPVAHLYWKFEAQTQDMTVHAFHSPDGNAWTDTGIGCPWSSVTTVKVDVSLDPSGSAPTQAAHFDDFNVKTCTP
jgi:hypothetical protein